MENPFPYSDSNKRYHTWDYHLRQKFGGKVFKIALDGGFSCPNIDGTCGRGGCTYCSYAFARQTPESLLKQLENGKTLLHKKWPDAASYIPYLQANTNTYAPLEELRSKYEILLSQENVVGLAIATRADALPDPVCDYLAEINRRTYLIVELGLQTAWDDTARRINRGHDWDTFLAGYEKLRSRGIPVCIHLINGLPGETEEQMAATAEKVAALAPHCVKIHLLHILKGTPMAEEFAACPGDFAMMDRASYIRTTCDQLERLPPETVIQRLTGDGLKDELIAPLWSLKKLTVLNDIDKELVRRNSWQGKLFTP